MPVSNEPLQGEREPAIRCGILGVGFNFVEPMTGSIG
jgi:hypothetical protein